MFKIPLKRNQSILEAIYPEHYSTPQPHPPPQQKRAEDETCPLHVYELSRSLLLTLALTLEKYNGLYLHNMTLW